MKITKNMVGKKIRAFSSKGSYFIVTAVGKTCFLAVPCWFEDPADRTFDLTTEWELVKEKKKKKLYASALVRGNDADDDWNVTQELYTSRTEVKEQYGDDITVIWPAIHNKNGYYEIKEGENDKSS